VMEQVALLLLGVAERVMRAQANVIARYVSLTCQSANSDANFIARSLLSPTRSQIEDARP
jgi:hypothetical protein